MSPTCGRSHRLPQTQQFPHEAIVDARRPGQGLEKTSAFGLVLRTQTITHPSPLPADLHQPGAAEHGEVARHVGLGSLQGCLEMANAKFAVGEERYDLESCFISESPEELRERSGPLLDADHYMCIFAFRNISVKTTDPWLEDRRPFTGPWPGLIIILWDQFGWGSRSTAADAGRCSTPARGTRTWLSMRQGDCPDGLSSRCV